MKKSTFIKYPLTIVFILLLFLPGMLRITGVEKFTRKDENRRFNDTLTIDIKRLDYFPEDFNSYTNDNFYFRAPLLNLFHRMKFSVLNISPHPEQARIGKDGWYFKAGIELEVIKGNKDFSPEVLDSFTNEWKKRTAYLKQLNIPVFWIIAPIKHNLYPEELPYNVHHSKTNRISVLQKHLQSDFPNLIINPLETLKENKGKGNLFFKLDNHWNTHAGYLTTQLLIERLRAIFPDKNIIDIPPFHWEGETIQKGYNYNVMGIDELSEYTENPVMDNPKSKEAKKYGFKGILGFAYPGDFEHRYMNDSLKNGLRVLFIRDSFGNAIIPFAREVFKESEFIFDAWQFKMNKPIIEQYKPDVVIFLGLETNVENYLKDYGKKNK